MIGGAQAGSEGLPARHAVQPMAPIADDPVREPRIHRAVEPEGRPQAIPVHAPEGDLADPADVVTGSPAASAVTDPADPADPAPAEAVPAEPETPPRYDLDIDPEAVTRAWERVDAMAPAELRAHFELFLYVNKAPEGILSQQMIVFEGEQVVPDAPVAARRWLVSTGRERHEGYFTTTPAGLYQLDPHRFRERHYSSRWNGVAMPWAMFFDYGYRDQRSGLAIHAANASTAKRLGTRDSGGCIRLAPAFAEELFTWIRRDFAGRVPVFAFDESAGHTDRTGRLARDEAGALVFKDGYKVLLIVDPEAVAPAPDRLAASE
ncbi:MAG: L,D-transpeptidase [Alphaproteobacteria bacterium]|nr:L,D-transpeptidase [Alphaproteobacteria bacterium]